MPDTDIIRLMKQFRAALDKQDEAALRQIIEAYRMIYSRLGGRIDALIQAAQNVENLTGPKLMRLQQYANLEEQLTRELSQFQVYLDTQVSAAARAALIRGDQDAYRLLRGIVGGRDFIRANFGRMPMEAVQTLIGFLQNDSPLYRAIRKLAKYHVDEILQGLIEGISLGDSPRTVARKLAELFSEGMGRGLTDALRIARTAQLYSYREATRANFILNDDVVSGWVWMADMGGDPPPCMACTVEHGTIHPLDELLDGHQNCRCAMVPVVLGQNPVEGMQTGEDIFNSLSEAEQRARMGKGAYEAWREGKFSLGDLVRQSEDATWGSVKTVTPLKDLVGESE
jgi:hypothetical protein